MSNLTDFTAVCPKCDKTFTQADFPCKNCGKDVMRLWDTTYDSEVMDYGFKCPHCDAFDSSISCPDSSLPLGPDCDGTQESGAIPTRISNKFIQPVLPEPEEVEGGCGAAAGVMLGIGIACAFASAELL